MGMIWVRLETALPTNPKTLALVEDGAFRAFAVYICGLSYCGAQGTEGFIPRAALPYIHGRKTEASKLVEVGLWTEGAGGWDVNGWEDFQASSEEIKTRSDKAKKAAAARWSKQEATKP